MLFFILNLANMTLRIGRHIRNADAAIAKPEDVFQIFLYTNKAYYTQDNFDKTIGDEKYIELPDNKTSARVVHADYMTIPFSEQEYVKVRANESLKYSLLSCSKYNFQYFLLHLPKSYITKSDFEDTISTISNTYYRIFGNEDYKYLELHRVFIDNLNKNKEIFEAEIENLKKQIEELQAEKPQAEKPKKSKSKENQDESDEEGAEEGKRKTTGAAKKKKLEQLLKSLQYCLELIRKENIFPNENVTIKNFRKHKVILLFETESGYTGYKKGSKKDLEKQPADIDFSFNDPIKEVIEYDKIISKHFDKDDYGFCLDTAHVYAKGIDLSDMKTVNDLFDKLFSQVNIRFIHFNGITNKLGSFSDNHVWPHSPYDHIWGKGAKIPKKKREKKDEGKSETKTEEEKLEAFKQFLKLVSKNNVPLCVEYAEDVKSNDDKEYENLIKICNDLVKN